MSGWRASTRLGTGGLGRAAGLALVVAAAAWAGRAEAAVALADTWAGGNIASGTLQFNKSIPASGTNRLLVVVMTGRIGSAVTTAPTCSGQYGGVTLTSAVTSGSAASNRAKGCVLYLNDAGITSAGNPGTNLQFNLTMTVSGQTLSGVAAYAAFYTGVNQTTPVSASTGNTSTSTSVAYAAALSAPAGGGVVVGAGAGNTSPGTASYSSGSALTYTSEATSTANSPIAVWDRLPTAAESDTVTTSWSTALNGTEITGIAVNPAAVSSTITIGNGSAEPAGSTKTAGQVGAIDAFSVQTNSGTATVTSVGVTLAFSAGTPLTNLFVNGSSACTGTTYGTLASPVAGANTIALTTSLNATTSSGTTNLYLCGTAGTVSANATVTGTVASVTAAGYSFTDNDTTSATLTVTPPPSIAIGNGSAEPASSSRTSGQVGAIDAFSVQTNSGTATVTSVGVTLAFSAGTPLTNVFVNSTSACTGTTYGTLASPVAGANTIALTTSVTATTTSSTTNLYLCGTAGTVSANATVTGTAASVTAAGYSFTDNDTTSATLTVTPPPVPGTTTGAISATVNACNLVTVSASYTGDTDGDNTVTFARSLDGVSYTTLTACANVGGGANPRTCADSTVAASTSYWYQATFADSTGGVSGTNPLKLAASVNTGVCAANLALTAPASQPAAATITVGAAQWTLVGQIVLAASSGTVSLASVNVANAATAPLATGSDLQLNLANAAGTVVYGTGTWDGSKWVFGTLADPTTGQPPAIGTTATPLSLYATANYGAAPGERFAMQVTAAGVAALPPASATTGATVSGNTFTTGAPALVNEGSLNSSAGPMVSIVNPEKGKVVSGNFLVNLYVYSGNGSAVTALGLATDGSTPTCATNDATITKDSHTYSNTGAAMYSKLVSALAVGTHTLKACATNGGGTLVSAPVTVTVVAAGAGDGSLLVRDNSSQLCTDCHDQNKVMSHSSESTKSRYGTWSTTCRDCHTPHSTRNLFLVKEQVVPPAVNGYQASRNVYLATTSGDSNVSGATSPASSSFANTDQSGICQACHTRTMNPARQFTNGAFTNAGTTVTTSSAVFASADAGSFILAPDGRSYSIATFVSATQVTLATAYQGATATAQSFIVGPARWRNSSSGNQDSHYTVASSTGTSSCGGCHSHAKGFAGGESAGKANCASCHGAIWNKVTGTDATVVSRHSFGSVVGTNDAFTDSGVNWGTATSLSTITPAQRSCVNTCHDDHVHDLSPATTHEQNGYTDARSAASRAMTRDAAGNVTAGTPAKVDFSYNATTQAWGGMCTSCHQTAVDATRPAVSAASFSGSGHDGISSTDGTTTWTWSYTLHDGSSFNRNCTKCHASRAEGTTPTFAASGSSTVAVHGTTDPSLLSGTKNPAGNAVGYVCYNCHGSAVSPANGAQGKRSTKDIQSQILHATTAGQSGHPTNSDSVHVTATELSSAAFGNTLGVTGRHVNCADCHDPHQAKAGLRTIGGASGATIGGALVGAWGADLTSNPAFWTAPASTNFAKATLVTGTPAAGQDNQEATLCFKCHSAFYGALPVSPSSVGLPAPIAAGGYTETDTALEFNPANAGNWKTAGAANTYDGGETAGSFHPVMADSSNNLGAITLTNLVTTNFAWSTTTRNRMRCSDCHASDVNTDPVGPHGSAAKFILRGPNTTWNASLNSVATTGIFCWNCHSINSTNTRYSAHGTHNGKAACFTCHSAIPHGSMRPGLLSAGNGGCGVNGGTTCGQTSMNINVGGPVVACANGNGAGTNCLATDNPPYNQAPSTYNKLRLAYYPANQTTNWGSTTAYCGCGNVIGGQGH